MDYWIDEARGTKVLDLDSESLTYSISADENAELHQLCSVSSSGSYGLIDNRGSMKRLDQRILSILKDLRPTALKYKNTLETHGFVIDDDAGDSVSDQALTDYVTKLALMVTFLAGSQGDLKDSIFMFDQLDGLQNLVQEFDKATTLAESKWIEFDSQTCVVSKNVKTECLVDFGDDWKRLLFIPKAENGLILGFDNVYWKSNGNQDECLSALDASETVFQR